MEQTRFRCHISIILNKIGAVLVFLGLLLYNNLDNVIEFLKSGRLSGGKILPASVLTLAAAFFYTVYHFMRWYKTWIMFEDESIVIERNTLNRKVNTIGMKNISNVNLEQNLFQRLLHVYQVKLDTNSASTANTTDVNIVLSEERARAFQQTVLEHLGKGRAVEKAKGQVEAPDITYSGAEVVKHCLSTLKISWLLIGVAAAVFAVIGLSQRLHEAADLVDILGGSLAVLAFLITTIWNLVGDFFRLYDFRARRSGNKLYLSHGLLKRQEYMIPVEKINSVIIRQNLMARILKRQYVELVCVGLGDEKREGTQIMLASKKEDLEKNMKLLLPEYEKESRLPLKKQPTASIYCKIPGYLIQLVICMIGAVLVHRLKPEWLPAEIAVVAVLIVYRVCYEVLRYQTIGFYCDEEGLAIADGVFTKRIVYIRYDKLQILRTKQGPFYSHYGLYQGELKILAAALFSIYFTGFYSGEMFERIHQGMLSARG